MVGFPIHQSVYGLGFNPHRFAGPLSHLRSLSHAIENLQASYPHITARRCLRLLVKARSAALLADIAQLLLGKFLSAGLTAHTRKFCDGEVLHVTTIPRAPTYKHVIPTTASHSF